MIKCPECEAIVHFVGIRHIDGKPHNRYECSSCDHKFVKTSAEEEKQLLLQFAERESQREPKR